MFTMFTNLLSILNFHDNKAFSSFEIPFELISKSMEYCNRNLHKVIFKSL